MEIKFTPVIYCGKCGKDLRIIKEQEDWADVEPCATCQKEAYDEGFEDGKKESN